MRQVFQPYEVFFDKDGDALENGSVWIGEVSKNPETNPIDVYTDKALTMPIAQPIRTIGGYLSRSGAPCALFVSGNYSMTVRNSLGELVYSILDSSEITTAGGDGTENAVEDFGAVGNGTTDNSAPFTNIFSADNSKIFIPAGVYSLNSIVDIDIENTEICGVRGQTVIQSSNLTKMFNMVRMVNSRICNITFISTSSEVAAADGVICGSAATLTNSIFTWNQISAALCNAGGFVINGTSAIDKFFYINNLVKDVGAKGVLFSGSTAQGLKLDLNVIENTGLFSGSGGAALSIGDNADGSSVSNTTIINPKTNVIDVYNCDKVVIENLVNTGTVGTCGARLDGVNDLKLCDCFFELTDFFVVNNTLNTRSDNINIKSTAINAMRITGTSQYNEFHLGTFDNSTSADDADNAVVLSDGLNSKFNRLSHLKLEPRPSKGMTRQINAAKQPALIHCYNTTGGDIVDSDLLDWTTFALDTEAGLVLEKLAKYQVINGVVYCFFKVRVLEDAGVTAGTFAIHDLPVAPYLDIMGGNPAEITRSERQMITGAASMYNRAQLPSPTRGKYYVTYTRIEEAAPAPDANRIRFGKFVDESDADNSMDMSTWRDELIMVGSFSYPAGS